MVMIKECSFEGCDRTQAAKGLCRAHYNQQVRGMELKPIRHYVLGLHKDENGRVCTGCRFYKTWDQYYEKRHAKCKKCVIKQNTLINERRSAS